MGKNKGLYPEEMTSVKKYTSFNIFTRDGQNHVVSTEKPMTTDEALYHFKALAISGND